MIADPLEPATVDEDGNPPENRFSSFAGLQSAYESAKREGDRNDIRFTSIRGIFDRNSPVDPEYMRAQGMEDMPNINTGEFPSKVESYVSTWVDLNTGGYKFATVKLKRKKENPPEVCDYYDEKATEFFNEAITEWDDDAETRSAANYILESCIRDTQMGLFGIGIPYFKDDTDWRECAIPTRKVFVPYGTKITLSNCPVLFVETENTVTGLYRLITNTKAEGWNKEQVMKLLYDRTSENKMGRREEFSEWQNRLRNNDSFIQTNFNPVLLVDAYVQEFNTDSKKDGISHYVFSRSGSPQEILFKKDRQYKSFRSFIIPFCDNSGPEGDWHGVKGFGDSIYDQCDFQNQFFNHMARSAIVNNMPMFQAGSESDRDKLSQIKWTMMGIVNPGIQLSQVNVRTDIGSMLAVYQQSERTNNSNSRTYPTGEAIQGRTKTATQETFDRQDQAKFTSLQIKFYRMVCLDALMAEKYRRLTATPYPETLPGGRAAASFRKKCEEAGVPKECYQEPIEVLADRTGGTGNMGLDIMKAEKLMGIASPGRGQLNARREIAKAVIQSGDRVEEFVQAEDLPADGQGYVDLENSVLTSGQMIPVEPNQEHLVHLGELSLQGKGHLTVLLTTYQTASGMAKSGQLDQNLEDAQKLDRTLEASLAHVAQHVQFLGQFGIPQYQQIAKDLGKTLNEIGQFVQTFREQIGAGLQAKQQAQGPQLTAKDQATLISAQVKAQVEAAMAQQRMQHKEQDHLQKLGNLAERSAFKSEADKAKLEQDMVHKSVSFNQELGQHATETMINMEREAAKTRAQHNAETVSE